MSRLHVACHPATWGCALLLLWATLAAAIAPGVVAQTPSTATARTAELHQQLAAMLSAPGVSRGTWGIEVRSLTTHDTLFAHNERSLLVPASIAKLVALAATVRAIGWDYVFETPVLATGPVVDGVLMGDLLVVGSGDPSIGGRAGEDFTPWIAALRAAGISRISGRIIGNDEAIEEPRPGAMWAWDDLGYTSGSLFGALNYAENRMLVTVTPGATVGAPVVVTVDPLASDRPLIIRATTVARDAQALLWPEQRPAETALTIAGTLQVGARPVRFYVSTGDPTKWFVGALRRALERGGITVDGDAVDYDTLASPPAMETARPIFVHRSKPLSDVARAMLKDSINVYSEAILRMSTGATGGRTNDDALAALKEQLGLWGLDPAGLQVVDGSGLSRRDTLAPDTLVGVLERMYDPTGASPWMTGLPVAGRDGTLENRFRNTAAEGVLRGKTGTMSNIRTLAGYVTTKDGEPLAFAIMLNNFEGTGAQAQAAIDAIAIRLASFSR